MYPGMTVSNSGRSIRRSIELMLLPSDVRALQAIVPFRCCKRQRAAKASERPQAIQPRNGVTSISAMLSSKVALSGWVIALLFLGLGAFLVSSPLGLA